MYNFISIDFAGYSSLRVKQYQNELYFPINPDDFMKYIMPKTQSAFKIYLSECINYLDALDNNSIVKLDLNCLAELARCVAELVKKDMPDTVVTYSVVTDGYIKMKEMSIEN